MEQKGLNYLSLFNGMGCGDLAFKDAGIKINKYYASEVDKYANSVAKYNNPNMIELGDVRNIDCKRDIHDKIEILIGGSPCFTAGCKIMCKGDSKKNIEDVVVGDYVLTHKNRYKKVIKIGGSVKDTKIIQIDGLEDIETTENHPFYIKKKIGLYWSDPDWICIKDIRMPCLCGNIKYIDDYIRWSPVINIFDARKQQQVYNLEVEDDNSYTANNAIVHNCQSFSFAGKQNGMSTKCDMEILSLEHYMQLKKENFEFEGQSYLFWEYMRLLKELKPKYFLLENVKMAKKWETILSNAIGVEPVMINSCLLTAQNRKRLYWCGKLNENNEIEQTSLFEDNEPKEYIQCKIPQPEDKGILLKDIIEYSFSQQLSEKEMAYMNRSSESFSNGKKRLDVYLKKEDDKAGCLTKSMHKGVPHNVIGIDTVNVDKAATIKRSYYKSSKANFNSVGGPHHATGVVVGSEPIEETIEVPICDNSVRDGVVCVTPRKEDGSQPYQQDRVYDINGKVVALTKGLSDIKITDKDRIINLEKGSTDKSWFFEQQCYSEDSPKTRTLKAGGGSGNIPKIYSGKIGECTAVDKPNKGLCKQIAIADDINGHDLIKRIYSEDGKSPCLTGGKGGNLEPKMVIGAAQRGRYNENGKIEQKIELNNEEKSNCLTTVQKDSLVAGRMVSRKLDSNGNRNDKLNVNNTKVIEINDDKNKIGTITTVQTDTIIVDGNSIDENIKHQDKEQLIYRKLTPRECELLQGVEVDKTLKGIMPNKKTGINEEVIVSNSRRYMMLGNGWTVPVIAHIFKEMFKEENYETDYEKNSISTIEYIQPELF